MKVVQFLLPNWDDMEGGNPDLYYWWRYPAGELQVRLTEKGIKEIESADRVLIVTKGVFDVTMLNLLVDSMLHIDIAKRIILYSPYLPYSRADRRFTIGDSFGLRVFIDSFYGVGIDILYTLDVHSIISEKQGYRLLTNISPKPFIEKTIENIGWPGRTLQLLLPDKGASRYGIDAPYCTKIRNPETGELSGFTVPESALKGATDILIIDDICDGGGTFIGIAKEIRKQLWTGNLYLYTTHGIYSKGFGELLTYFNHLYCSDSFPNKGSDKWLTQYPSLSLLPKELNGHTKLL